VSGGRAARPVLLAWLDLHLSTPLGAKDEMVVFAGKLIEAMGRLPDLLAAG
jgi:hypothetical protein